MILHFLSICKIKLRGSDFIVKKFKIIYYNNSFICFHFSYSVGTFGDLFSHIQGIVRYIIFSYQRSSPKNILLVTVFQSCIKTAGWNRVLCYVASMVVVHLATFHRDCVWSTHVLYRRSQKKERCQQVPVFSSSCDQ